LTLTFKKILVVRLKAKYLRKLGAHKKNIENISMNQNFKKYL